MNCVTCQIRTDFIFNSNSYVPPAFCRRALVILSRQALNFNLMPLLTFDKVLKIISTILNILSAALAAFGSSWNVPSDHEDSDGHA